MLPVWWAERAGAHRPSTTKTGAAGQTTPFVPHIGGGRAGRWAQMDCRGRGPRSDGLLRAAFSTRSRAYTISCTASQICHSTVRPSAGHGQDPHLGQQHRRRPSLRRVLGAGCHMKVDLGLVPVLRFLLCLCFALVISEPESLPLHLVAEISPTRRSPEVLV